MFLVIFWNPTFVKIKWKCLCDDGSLNEVFVWQFAEFNVNPACLIVRCCCRENYSCDDNPDCDSARDVILFLCVMLFEWDGNRTRKHAAVNFFNDDSSSSSVRKMGFIYKNYSPEWWRSQSGAAGSVVVVVVVVVVAEMHWLLKLLTSQIKKKSFKISTHIGSTNYLATCWGDLSNTAVASKHFQPDLHNVRTNIGHNNNDAGGDLQHNQFQGFELAHMTRQCSSFARTNKVIFFGECLSKKQLAFAVFP